MLDKYEGSPAIERVAFTTYMCLDCPVGHRHFEINDDDQYSDEDGECVACPRCGGDNWVMLSRSHD